MRVVSSSKTSETCFFDSLVASARCCTTADLVIGRTLPSVLLFLAMDSPRYKSTRETGQKHDMPRRVERCALIVNRILPPKPDFFRKSVGRSRRRAEKNQPLSLRRSATPIRTGKKRARG